MISTVSIALITGLILGLTLYLLGPKIFAESRILWEWSYRRFGRTLRHYRSRRIEPAVGQVWEQEDPVGRRCQLEVTLVDAAGRVCIRAGSAGWSEDKAAWQRRCTWGRLVLVRPGYQH